MKVLPRAEGEVWGAVAEVGGESEDLVEAHIRHPNVVVTVHCHAMGHVETEDTNRDKG